MPTAKPAVSDRKRAANRADAQKSTGPRTAEGKARAKNNAIRHGLRAEQVVLPWEDAEAFEAMRQAWVDDWEPPTDARRALVELAVAQAWAVRRGIGQHRDRLAELGYAAMDRHDREVEARVAARLDLLADDPAWTLALLRSEPAGVEALIGLWGRLADALGSPTGWADPGEHHGRLMNLLGHRADAPAREAGDVGPASVALVVYNDPTLLGEGDAEVGAGEAEAATALLRRVAAEVTRRLVDSLAALGDPHEARLDAARAAAFDPSPEGLIRLRYMAHHERSFRANLDQLIKLTRTGTDLVDEAESASQVVDAESITIEIPVAPDGATEAVATPGVVAPNEATEPTPPRVADAPNGATEAVAARAEAAPIGPPEVVPNEATEADPGRASTRDREGRVWPISGADAGPGGLGTASVGDGAVIEAGPCTRSVSRRAPDRTLGRPLGSRCAPRVPGVGAPGGPGRASRLRGLRPRAHRPSGLRCHLRSGMAAGRPGSIPTETVGMMAFAGRQLGRDPAPSWRTGRGPGKSIPASRPG